MGWSRAGARVPGSATLLWADRAREPLPPAAGPCHDGRQHLRHEPQDSELQG